MTGITAGILTGGKSSRMGCDKALLPYRGETFLAHLAGQLDWCDEILISVGRTGGEALAPWGTLVRDELEGFGPVEGIYQLLCRRRSSAHRPASSSTQAVQLMNDTGESSRISPSRYRITGKTSATRPKTSSTSGTCRPRGKRCA